MSAKTIDHGIQIGADIGVRGKGGPNTTAALREVNKGFHDDLEVTHVCCIGAGHAGVLSMAVMAENWPEITFTIVDSNQSLIESWQGGEVLFYEPGFEELFSVVMGKNLYFSHEIDAAIQKAHVIFIAVDVAIKAKGIGAGCRFDLTNWESAVRKIMSVSTTPKVVVEKSTVPIDVGNIIMSILGKNQLGLHFSVFSNPDFFSQGTAVQDLREPSRVVIASRHNKGDVFTLQKLYSRWVPIDRIVIVDDHKSVELGKIVVVLKKKVTHVHQHAFIRDHFLGIGKDSALLGWVQSFFKQFYASVTKSDYTTLRLGFIMTHCKGSPKFNFHKYMMRALEDDFRVVVGISWYLWIFVVIFLLLNVNGWHTYFWIAFIPFILLLAVGTKLEHVISQLAHEVAEKHIAIEGDLVVQPSDAHFWFGEPRIVLFLIHFILFQNAFEIAFFFWIWVQYGFDSCIMGQVRYIVPRLIIGVFIQVLCSYSTLPLYAIVTQMGTHFKKSIFDEHVQVGLVGWANKVKKKTALKAANNGSDQGSSHDTASVRIQLGKFMGNKSVPEEIQPAATSQEPK